MISNDKVMILGCKSTTRLLADSLSELVTIDLIVTIAPTLAEKNEVADYEDLSDYCREKNIKFYQAKSYNLKSEEDFRFFKNENISLCFVMGWQRLVPENILNLFSIGAFGMHGSAVNLPLGRGRSPMNWGILEGRKQFYTNLFKYDPGVDSGDILDTIKFEIHEKDTAETMHFKNTMSMIYLVKRNLRKLLNRDFILKKQSSDIIPTFYPKREPENSIIDWAQDIILIERFIRAVTYPFNGAFTFVNDQDKLIIISSQIFDYNEFGFENNKAGEVVQVFPNGKFLVKCFGGLLLINNYEYQKTIKKGDFLTNAKNEIKVFQRNTQGFFDIT